VTRARASVVPVPSIDADTAVLTGVGLARADVLGAVRSSPADVAHAGAVAGARAVAVARAVHTGITLKAVGAVEARQTLVALSASPAIVAAALALVVGHAVAAAIGCARELASRAAEVGEALAEASAKLAVGAGTAQVARLGRAVRAGWNASRRLVNDIGDSGGIRKQSAPK